MIRSEALALATKITASWPNGRITIDTWAEVLEEMHYGPAELTIRIQRDTAEHQPSIAQFRTAYRSHLGSAREPQTHCGSCPGDGWVTVKYEVNGREYEGLKPCRCRNGQEMQDVHRRIVNGNEAELRSHGRTVDHDAVGPPRFHRGDAA